MAMTSPSPQQRAETPPPRRRGTAGCHEDYTTQQQVWSAKPGSERDDWTSSPLTNPRETFSLKETKDDTILSPKAKAMNLIPVRVDEDACFSSPKAEKGGYGFDLANDPGLFTSPQPAKAIGKENRQPGQILATALARAPLTPLKTPSRLPTVQEHEGQTLPLDEYSGVGLPAWVVQTPTPAVQEELSIAVHDLGLSPAPPGLEDVKCDLPKPTNKNTFIQFVSPLKTFSVMTPPKTVPVNFAPSASVVSTLFPDNDDFASSYSPMPWCTHEQIPCFPAQNSAASSMPLAAEPDPNLNATEPRQKGPVVRLAEFLPDPPSACQPSAIEQAFWNMSTVGSLPMPPMMPGTEMPMQFATGADGMTAPSAFTCPTLPMMPDALSLQTQQWQLQHQMQQSTMQQQQMQLPLLPSPPMHPSEQLQQLPETQVQQPQSQMQLPSMQPQLLQPPQMQLPQMQPPPMPPPQMQAPTLQAPQPPMQAEQLFLQQLMQLQMAPPTWPPMQPPQLVAGEQVPAPPPQAPMEAPSVLCPSTCHQSGVCRCGEGALFSAATSPSTCCAKSDEQAPILLSAAMFPEMGANTVANNNRQRL